MGDMERLAIDEFLAKQIIGHVGAVRADGRPFILPVQYVYEGQTIYYATEQGQRLSTLTLNPLVCFEVDEAVPELGSYRSVVAYGRARIVEDPSERQRVLRRLIGRFEQMSPLWMSSRHYPAHALSGHEELRDLVVVAVTLEEVTGRQYAAA